MECDYPVMAASGGAAAQPAPRPGAEQDGGQRGRGAGGSPQPGQGGQEGRCGGQGDAAALRHVRVVGSKCRLSSLNGVASYTEQMGETKSRFSFVCHARSKNEPSSAAILS